MTSREPEFALMSEVTVALVLAIGAIGLLPITGSAQLSFPKTDYYLGMGDSIAAGTGALPVTNGYVYLLYQQGAFGRRDQALQFWLGLVSVPAGSRLAYVDLYTPSVGRRGLVLLERRLGYTGAFDFDFHPTNLGHTFIARQFAEAWRQLN